MTSYNPEKRETTSVLSLSSVTSAKNGINYRCSMTMSETSLVSGAQLYVTDGTFDSVPSHGYLSTFNLGTWIIVPS